MLSIAVLVAVSLRSFTFFMAALVAVSPRRPGVYQRPAGGGSGHRGSANYPNELTRTALNDALLVRR